MAASKHSAASIFVVNLRTGMVVLALAAVCATTMIATPAAQAQSFNVLYNLNGGSDGSGTINGLAIDREGNLYGTAVTGGISNCPLDPPGCGTVFKLSRHNDSWIYTVLYSFTGVSDGFWPQTIAVGPNGSLYGTTISGGIGCNDGCGTVFRLQPPVTFCRSVSCPWTKTTLFQFDQGPVGAGPLVTVTFDSAGNIYGGTNAGGHIRPGHNLGVVPLRRWVGHPRFYALQYTGGQAGNGVVFDAAGNLWGSGDGGEQDCGGQNQLYACGVIWELTPSASGWNQAIVFNFDSTTGGGPIGTFRFDQAGNLHGTHGQWARGMAVFSTSHLPAVIQSASYAAAGNDGTPSVSGSMVIDGAGNLYAADPADGPHDHGYVIRLTPSNGKLLSTPTCTISLAAAMELDPSGHWQSIRRETYMGPTPRMSSSRSRGEPDRLRPAGEWGDFDHHCERRRQSRRGVVYRRSTPVTIYVKSSYAKR